VQRQTYQDVEIILVDDGSSDNSGLLCNQLAEKDPRIRVIHQENQGLSGARNTGIRQAQGDFLIFMDSDDEWLLDDGLEVLSKYCDVTIDMVTFKMVHIWNQTRYERMADYDVETISHLKDAQDVFTHLVQSQQLRVSACVVLVSRKILIDNNIFFPHGLISEDVFWTLNLWQQIRNVKVVNLNFYGYHHRESSITTSPSVRVDRSYDTIFTHWSEQCQQGCINSAAIRAFMANLWVSRGYNYHRLQTAERPEAFSILKRHAGLLHYAATPKSHRVAKMVQMLGIRNTLIVLGWYWQLRIRFKR
jgi:glycosyltransferase involved in cell wall biosynthesis